MKQTLVLKLMKWIKLFYYKDLTVSNAFDRKVVHLFFLWKKTKGDAWTASTFKLARLAITRTLGGQSLPRPFGISLCKKTNLPTMLPMSIRKEILRGNPMVISWVLTVLQLSRTILGKKQNFKTTTITDPWTGSNPMSEASIALVARRMKLEKFQPSDEFTFPWISTAGPNGLSILTSFWDILNIPESLLSHLCVLGGKEFESKVRSLKGFQETTNFVISKILKIKKEPKTKFLRRLSIKEDKENKSRPFAIVDYITQSALTPLHDKLYSILREIPQDATFDQNKGFKDILYSPGPYYSFDLTAATDRFPIQVQEAVLGWLVNKEYARSWVEAMISEPFVTPYGETIRFNTGQPLGAKSSWALFSLSHHFVVQYCAMLENIDDPRYKILGDDIVIQDERLASRYKEVMTTLGVSISPVKTHESKTLFEFAKRFGYRGIEITQFPITALLSDLSNYVNLVGVLATTAVERGNLPLYILGGTTCFWEGLVGLTHKEGTRIFENQLNKCRLISYLLSSNKPLMVAMSDLIKFASAAQVELEFPEIFTAYKNAVMYLKDREIDKLATMSMKAHLSAQSMLMQILFLPWQGRVTTDYRSFIPVIDVIDEMKETYVDFRSEFADSKDLVSLNGTLDKHPIRPMPNLNGLQPVRPRLLAGQSRAALIKPFIKQLKLMRDSKKIADSQLPLQ